MNTELVVALISAGVSALGIVIVMVVLPMLGYLVQRKDKDFDRLRDKVDANEKEAKEMSRAVTETSTKVEAMEGLIEDVQEIRETMATRADIVALSTKFDKLSSS
jgi:uncharacterized membrane protein YhiD involved in acid resistance